MRNNWISECLSLYTTQPIYGVWCHFSDSPIGCPAGRTLEYTGAQTLSQLNQTDCAQVARYQIITFNINMRSHTTYQLNTCYGMLLRSSFVERLSQKRIAVKGLGKRAYRLRARAFTMEIVYRMSLDPIASAWHDLKESEVIRVPLRW